MKNLDGYRKYAKVARGTMTVRVPEITYIIKKKKKKKKKINQIKNFESAAFFRFGRVSATNIILILAPSCPQNKQKILYLQKI